MALSIKSDEADRLARQVAAATGESLTEAVVGSLRERLERLRAVQAPSAADRIRRLQQEVRELEIRDPRTSEEILGYDGDGLPHVTVGIVVDSSAVVAILQSEDGHDVLLAHLTEATRRLMSAATRVELGIVMEARYGPPGRDLADRFLRDSAIELVAVDGDTADRALAAWRRYGKGRHPAALNFGDCFAYALADETGYPLLCTGNDFAATDLPVRVCP